MTGDWREGKGGDTRRTENGERRTAAHSSTDTKIAPQTV